MVIEYLGGYFAGSLAIMTDAAHLTTDCVTFLIGLAAIWISRKPADNKMSFGYRRIEVLGAILSILGIWVLTALLFYLAVERIITNDFEIDANVMMLVGFCGIAINVVMVFILHGEFAFSIASSHGHSHGHHHQHHDHNQHGNNNTASNDIKAHSTVLTTVTTDEETHPIPAFVKHETSGEIRPRAGSFSNRNVFANSATTGHIRTRSDSSRSLELNNCIDFSYEVPYRELNHTIPVNNNINNNNNKENGSVELRKSLPEEKNLNLRAAVIHVLGDLIQSVGVFIASVIIKLNPEAKIADPLCTLLFSVIVIFTTIKVMKDSLIVVMDAVPHSISYQKLEEDLTNLHGVRSVHHLNVWSQTVNNNLLMAHLTIEAAADSNLVLKSACSLARKKYEIKHCTFQIERYHPHDS